MAGTAAVCAMMMSTAALAASTAATNTVIHSQHTVAENVSNATAMAVTHSNGDPGLFTILCIIAAIAIILIMALD